MGKQYVHKFYMGLVDRDGKYVDPDTYVEETLNHEQGFTVTQGIGFWNEASEPSLVIEAISLEPDMSHVAKKLCEVGNQVTVLYTKHEVDVEYVNR